MRSWCEAKHVPLALYILERHPVVELKYQTRRLWQIAVRKLRTIIQGPPIHPDIVKAAHYFADGWTLNMWQVVDRRRIDDDLEMIKSDGFNTIIIVVPWRGFQLDQLEPAYDAFYMRQLRRVMAAADRRGLSVIVRVSYSHQTHPEDTLSGITQAQRLLLDEETRQAWLHYLGRLYEICHGYRSFRQGFLCWEEFWHAFRRWQMYKPKIRKRLAIASGFSAYLGEQSVEGISEIPRPEHDDYPYFHAFANARVREMYELAASVFPGLSMEFRVDKDRQQDNSSAPWLSNDNYSDLLDLRYSYWAPFMGAANEGEQLDAQQAAELFSHMLQEVSDLGRIKNHVVDQFNFLDSTPQYQGVHAEISNSEMPAFLKRAAPLLREYSAGYGVWAYRDYVQNVMYNARFLMGMRGWQLVRGKCTVLRRGGVRLGSGGLLRQRLPARGGALQSAVDFESLTLQIDLHRRPADVNLEVRINSGPWMRLEPGLTEQSITLEYPVDRVMIVESGVVFELRNNGSALSIYTVYFYHYLYRGGIRLEDGTPSLHHQAVVSLNRDLGEGGQG